MKPLYLHIGAEKCASSLIEVVFMQIDGMVQAMRSQGIEPSWDLHMALRQAAPHGGWDASAYGPIRDQVLVPHLEGPAQGVFTSEETLLSLRHGTGEENQSAAAAEIVEQLAEGFDPRLLIIFRRQDTFIESLYNQLVKRGETQDFVPWFNALPLANYEWDRVADVFVDRFGAEKVTVIPYESGFYGRAPEAPANLLSAICGWLGLGGMAVDMASFPIVNPSLPLTLLPAQREINQTLAGETAAQVADILARNTPKTPGDRLGLLGDAERQAVVERFRESNQRLFERHMPDFPPDAYLAVDG